MAKRVYVYDDQQAAWVEQTTGAERYVYDGWNVIELLETTSNVLEMQFCWGLDVSGSLHGAGGVGGLLAHRYISPVDSDDFWHFYDGNGNLTESVSTARSPTGIAPLVGWYVYGPYGQIVAQMDYARDHQFRFSTKWLVDDLAAVGQGGVMDDTGLYYYGHRFYSAETGRWLSRDPIGETGGLNLYAFVRNEPVGRYDIIGLQSLFDSIIKGVKVRIEFDAGRGLHAHIKYRGKESYYKWARMASGRMRFVVTEGVEQTTAINKLLGSAQAGKVRTAINRGKNMRAGGFITIEAAIAIAGWTAIIGEVAYGIDKAYEIEDLAVSNYNEQMYWINRSAYREKAQLVGKGFAKDILGSLEFYCCYSRVTPPNICVQDFINGMGNLFSFTSLMAYDKAMGKSTPEKEVSIERSVLARIERLYSCVRSVCD